MTDAWKERWRQAIMLDGRSEAAICEAAELSRNYIGSIFRDNREPTVPRLLALCDALNVSATYVLVGLNISPETERMISLLQRNPKKAAALFQLLGGSEEE